jgi:hypothetical protein
LTPVGKVHGIHVSLPNVTVEGAAILIAFCRTTPQDMNVLFDVAVWFGEQINMQGRATGKPPWLTNNEPIAPR